MTVTTGTDQDVVSGEPARSSAPLRRPLLVAGATAAAASAVAATGYRLAIRAAGVPMKAGFLGATTAAPLKISSFAMGTIICTSGGRFSLHP